MAHRNCVSFLLLLVWASFSAAADKTEQGSAASLAIFHSNDFMGYLTPCG